METVLVYLIITMGSHVTMAYPGFGGVSVTQMPTMQVCEQMKPKVANQIQMTDNLYFDDNEILIRCEAVTEDN